MFSGEKKQQPGQSRGSAEEKLTGIAQFRFMIYAILDGIFLRAIVEPDYASEKHCEFVLDSVKRILEMALTENAANNRPLNAAR